MNQEQFQAKAKASGQAAQRVALATWQGARTTAEKMVLVGGALGIISFFLPWYSVFLFQGSGLTLARNAKPSLWFFPITMAAALFLSWLHLHSDPRKRILAGRWLILIGAAWTWHWLSLLISSEATISFGGFLAALASILVLTGGLIQVRQQLNATPTLIAAAQADQRRCPRCSASVQPDSAFCDSCGNKAGDVLMHRRVLQVISVAALSSVLLILCGCEIGMDVHLRADGTGTANVICYLSPADQAMGLTAAAMKQALSQQSQQRPDVKITRGTGSDGAQYAKAAIPFANVQDLASAQYGVYQYEKQANGDRCTFRILNFSLAQSVAQVRFEIRMSGKILASNADSVHNNVARWSDTALRRIAISNSSEGLYAQSETSGTFPYLPVLLVVAGAVFPGALLYLLRARHLKLVRQPITAAPVQSGLVCPACGAQQRSSTVVRFCAKCGTQLMT